MPKAVATLAGSGVTRDRTAIGWGTVPPWLAHWRPPVLLTGSRGSSQIGVVEVQPDEAFTVAVLAGVTGWVAVATVVGFNRFTAPASLWRDLQDRYPELLAG